MTPVSRRRLLTGTAAAVGATALVGPTEAVASGSPARTRQIRALTVAPTDVRYSGLTSGQNQLFSSRPEAIRLPNSTAQVVAAVQEAVTAGKRISVRGGGHCYENFVDHPDVKVIIDMSAMRAVAHDARMRAFSVEGGATLGEMYQAMFRQWGVTLPGGACYSVGVGGHVTGGGYGNLVSSTGWSSTTCTPSRSSWSTPTDGPVPSSPPGRPTIPTGTCGGPTPAAVAAPSAS